MDIQEETKEQVEKLESEKVESETTEKTEEGEETAVEGTQKETEGKEEVPASFQKRINELVYKYKSERETRQKLEEQLKSKRQNPAQPTSEEEKREQSAREYLRGLLREELSAQKSEEEAETTKLNEELDHISAIYPDFKREEVLRVMEKFGIDNVEKAYFASKEMKRETDKAKEDTKKDLLSKPKSPSSVKTQDTLGSKFSEENIRNKSLWELAEEAKKEAGF